MGSNADGNTAVKWKKDEQCSLVTLLTACWSCMDSKLCSIGLKTGQNLFLFTSSCTRAQESTFTSVNLGDGVGVGTRTGVMGTGWGWGQRLRGWGRDGFCVHGDGRDGVQFLSPCRPLIQMMSSLL